MKRLLEVSHDSLWLPDDIWLLLWLQCDSPSRHALRRAVSSVWRSTQHWKPRLDLTLQCHSACGHPGVTHLCEDADKTDACLEGLSVEVVPGRYARERPRYYRHERFEAHEFALVVRKDRCHFHLSRSVATSWFRVQSTQHLIQYNEGRVWHPTPSDCLVPATNVVECLLSWVETGE